MYMYIIWHTCTNTHSLAYACIHTHSHTHMQYHLHSPIPRFPDLLSRLPAAVRSDRYCSALLDILHSHHCREAGPDQWSKARLVAILSTLRPWELRSPETAAAVKVRLNSYIAGLACMCMGGCVCVLEWNTANHKALHCSLIRTPD